MAKRRIPESEKLAIILETLAKEGPRNPAHDVTVSVQDKSDDNGEPIVTVMRMRSAKPGGRRKSKRT